MHSALINSKNRCLDGDYLLRALQNYVQENIIIGGDLNIILDKVQQDVSLSKNMGYANKLQQLIELLNVVDVCRVKNLDTVRYTRREKSRFGLNQSRIDFFLISENMEYVTNRIDILPSTRSDHSLLVLGISLEKEHKGGKGL